MPDDRPLASPVFVDPTGRRRRTVRRAAVVGAGVLIGTVALLVAALLGAPLGPLTSLPDPIPGPPAAVEQIPAPQPTSEAPGRPAPTSSHRPGNNPAVAPVVTRSTTSPGDDNYRDQGQ
jgi:hypothetical protein